MPSFLYPPVDSRLQSSGCYLTSVGALTYQRDQPYPVEGHRKGFAFEWERGRAITDFAMVMIVDGTGEWEAQRGESEIVNCGDLLYLVPGGWHRYRPASATGWREKWCCLSGAFIHGLVTTGFLPSECCRISGGLNKGAEAQLDLLTQEVLATSGMNHPSWGMRALAVLLECMNSAKQKSLQRYHDPVVAKALDFIDGNLHRPIGVTDIALNCRVQRRTLERRFTEEGLGAVGRYLVDARIARAETLLRETSLSVKEIAFACGFGGAQRMIYDFRCHRGITPGKLREQLS